jgi:excisionase family DNA binding protein
MEEHHTALVTADPTQVGTIYTTAEVARLLRVHQRTVQEWIRVGMLPAVRYGRLLRIRQTDLATFGDVVHGHPAPVDPATKSSSPEPPTPGP